MRLRTLWAATLVASLLMGLFLAGTPLSDPAAAASQAAPGGCGTTAPTTIGPHGVFQGVIGIPKGGTTPGQVLHSIPGDSVALWCARQVFVHPAGEAVPGEAIVQFLAKASPADVQRAAAYLRRTGLFGTVTVVPHPRYY
jgi:hypothetical protein